MPVVMPANAAPCNVDIGRNQSIALSAGKPGNNTRPEKAPANAVMRKTGIATDGRKVEGTLGISLRLRSAIPHVTCSAAMASVSASQPGPEGSQSGRDSKHEDRAGDGFSPEEVGDVQTID